jgi:hypothetical protein
VKFARTELEALGHATERAEELTGDFYHLPGFGPKRYLYEVATTERLTPAERAPEAFAHLCRYVAAAPTPGDRRRPGRYYRICLQDPSILAAVERAAGEFPLATLLLYIMTHELIHIVRFERFQHPFQTDPARRDEEEQRVHAITADVLRRLDDVPMRALLGYYREHRIPRCL